MTDYFSEYSSFIGAKGLPSPADTPYETPGFIRSKRSSRATAGSSREQSSSPPPLPPDTKEVQEKTRDGRYTALDPRRFTPTLHASLVSEILSLRRELDSKNHLVENLETNLSTSKTENDALTEKLTQSTKEVRLAKQQVSQMEKGTYEAVEDLVKERDAAISSLGELKVKLETAQKTARRQDEDAMRTQRIWESDKENWDNERRQLERRIHVTENRLRTFVEEMTAQQAAEEAQLVQIGEPGDESLFKDSGIGNESDTASVRSSATPVKHRRNVSNISNLSHSSRRSRNVRNSTSTARNIGTPEPCVRVGHTLADELGIDEEDEYDIDEFEHADDELDYPEAVRKTMGSRQGSTGLDMDAKAKRVLGLTNENVGVPASPTMGSLPKRSLESPTLPEPVRYSMERKATRPSTPEPTSVPKAQYVDSGYQPSPPPSPLREDVSPRPVSIPQIEEPSAQRDAQEMAGHEAAKQHALEVTMKVAASPISPPDTPIGNESTWAKDKSEAIPHPAYVSASTQTELVEPGRPKALETPSKRDSLSPPMFVPSIAIHPPASRPASPRSYVLPPGTKNASTDANIPWPSRDACIQTEEIRIDRRPVKLPAHLLPNYLLPSPTFEEPRQPKQRVAPAGTAKIFTKAPPPLRSPPSPPNRSPPETSPVLSRDSSQKDLRSMPLRAIPLPRPVLSPIVTQEDPSEGPLNRSARYGVTKPAQGGGLFLDMDNKDSDVSDHDDIEPSDLAGSIPALSKPPHGRFGLSEPPKAVPEDKEISPERRPGSSDSHGAAPAPSVSSSRANSQRNNSKPPGKRSAQRDFRSRSPSFGSMASSSYSAHAAIPPYPIPTRSSSRAPPVAHSEGSQSPTPHHGDVFSHRNHRSNRTQPNRPGSLRKVQSAAVIRHSTRRSSPQKSRRRRHSPDLTPVQSMAFDSPPPNDFPVPELPTPLQDSLSFQYVKGSVDLGNAPTTAASSTDRNSQETGLVDAIATTMVGEWMWKYIRKRKSFGVGEDFPLTTEDGSFNVAAHGSRHKRWVWLSPYERTIMWDNKQPTSGNALLGKKGRKLNIQSVLEVRDETPLPKGAELRSAFNRSILILTSERALKFTTISHERHALWMTALVFLAQSGQAPSQLLPLPPIRPPIPSAAAESANTKRQRAPSFGRSNVRDSIRVAKGKRPDLSKSGSQPDSGPSGAMAALEGGAEDHGAAFPAVPRLYISTTKHQRKRSNTSPRLPPLSGLRSFSSSAVPSSASSVLPGTSSVWSSSRPPLPAASSKSGSRCGSAASRDRPNFFEAVGTVRMEAFVDPNVRDGVRYVPAPPPQHAQPKRLRGDSSISQTTADKRRAGYVFDEWGQDPFKHF